ncbi:MAG: helix-turn-helix transcriptional regulator [Caldilineaceae bacterium]|nr:helix-turn-helix transcriptional regulator [Caldilineaceae bacterium]MBP8107634.1 helix-turn-helix transcriptional regulator [Caldilineaceae bacterium]MBP8123257.1 helix-turn-helix transcriptional regulator [Caldilineaceae bacterium]
MNNVLVSPKVNGQSSTGGCCAPGLVIGMGDGTAENWANTFKALGHPVRVKMLDILSRLGGQVCVCDLEAQFDLSQPTISHHLKVLRQAGLVVAEQRGQWLFYRVQGEIVQKLTGFLAGLA